MDEPENYSLVIFKGGDISIMNSLEALQNFKTEQGRDYLLCFIMNEGINKSLEMKSIWNILKEWGDVFTQKNIPWNIIPFRSIAYKTWKVSEPFYIAYIMKIFNTILIFFSEYNNCTSWPLCYLEFKKHFKTKPKNRREELQKIYDMAYLHYTTLARSPMSIEKYSEKCESYLKILY